MNRRAWAALLVVWLVHAPAASAQAPTSVVQGRIVDAQTGTPLASASITLAGTRLRTATGSDGRFAFPAVDAGVYTLRAVRLGYDDLVREGVEVFAGADLQLDLAMTPEVIPLEVITVTPGAFTFMGSGSSLRHTMSREDIESVPQIGEDVFRAVNRLPGLSSGDYSAHFSIRGGRHDETLIRLDGLQLYEPYHLKDFNEGAISIVDTETIEGVELLTGGFPAQYGNKRSGVFDITSRKVDLDESRYSVGLSFLKARAMAMGPLWGGKASWLASARSGYMDLLFSLIDQKDLPKPRYHDVFAKMDVDLSARHRLSFDVLYAGDKYTFNTTATTGFQDTLKTVERAENRYGNSYVWSTLESSLGERTRVRTMASVGLVTRNRDGAESYVDYTEPIYTIKNDREFALAGVAQDWTQEVADSYVLSFGADFRGERSDDSYTSVVGQDPNDPSQDVGQIYPIVTSSKVDFKGSQLGVYLNNRLRPVGPLIFDVGGRYDQATWTGDEDWSPRASGSLALGGSRTLRLAWGYYRQIQGIDDVAALNANQTFYPSELSEQWTAGLEQRFGDGSSVRVEGYLKDGSHLRPVYRNWKGAPDTFPEGNEDRILVYPRSSKARGVEAYYDHRLGRRLALRASYAYAISEEVRDRIENVNGPDNLEYDLEGPTPQDQRHAANLDFTYYLRRVWSLNGSFVFHTGWPTTLQKMVPVVDDNGNPDYAVVPEKIYGARLPSYIRLDLRATRRWSTEHGDWRFFLEVLNLTNHANVFGYDYRKEKDPQGDFILVREEETWFSILPSAGVSWTSTF
jgi:outer membrane receptor for ferrienterochelin and colicin